MNRKSPPSLLAGQPPWRPTTASWATLFLLPLAGGLVTAVNLIRLGRADKAAFALVTGLGSLFFLLTVWSMGRTTGDFLTLSYIVLSLGDVGLFLYLQHDDFSAWQKAHPRQQPSSPWGAAAWALLGFGAMLMIAVAWAVFFILLSGGPATPDGTALIFVSLTRL